MSGTDTGWLADAVSAFGQGCKRQLDGAGEPEAAIRSPIEDLLDAAASALSLTMVPHGSIRYTTCGSAPTMRCG